MRAASALTKCSSSPATRRSSRFPIPPTLRRCKTAPCAGLPTPIRARTRSYAPTLTAARSSTAPLKAPARATAPRSRRRSSRSRTRSAISSSLNRWACIHRSCTFKVSPPPCRRMCRSTLSARSRGWKTPKCSAAPMPSSTTASIPRSCAPRSRAKRSPGCTVRGSSTDPPATRKPPCRVSLRA